VQEGVEIFLTIAAWPLVRVENWVELSHVRANENQSYLISSNCAGFSRETRFLGHSAVVDPHGISVAQGGLSQCIVKSEIDLGKLRKFRKDVPHLRNRILSV
ncbi:MAG: nitrilase-related carbon-nitrogen hydrolase, partial [Candidatus Bipolaricaulota bacterium]